jgi:hypothetical protein
MTGVLVIKMLSPNPNNNKKLSNLLLSIKVSSPPNPIPTQIKNGSKCNRTPKINTNQSKPNFKTCQSPQTNPKSPKTRNPASNPSPNPKHLNGKIPAKTALSARINTRKIIHDQYKTKNNS